jgi:hypothetical protein
MKSAKEFMRAGRALVLFGGLMITLTGCDDFLAVDNLTAPDREDATASPSDLEAFIAGSFYPSMFNALHNDEDATAAFPLQAAEFSATMQGQDTQLQYGDHVAEPRAVHDNGIVVSLGNGPQGPRDVWAHVHETNSVVHDGLEVLLGSVAITEGSTDVTPRARAFAKLIQGWSWGYLGLLFDEAHVVPEDVPIPQDPDALLEVTLETLTPYPEVIAAAVAALEEAIAIAEQNPSVVAYPSFSESNLWFGTANPVSNTDFIELANTLAARFLVLSARDPQERAAVDWGRVLAFTANGLTTDLEFELSNQRQSVLLNHFTNDPNGERNYRWDYRAIGPADQSGAYQDWIASPLDQRDRFDIVTPDRRITGPTPTSDGSYTAYRADDNGFIPDRGRYAYSAYQWRRHAFSVGGPRQRRRKQPAPRRGARAHERCGRRRDPREHHAHAGPNGRRDRLPRPSGGDGGGCTRGSAVRGLRAQDGIGRVWRHPGCDPLRADGRAGRAGHAARLRRLPRLGDARRRHADSLPNTGQRARPVRATQLHLRRRGAARRRYVRPGNLTASMTR